MTDDDTKDTPDQSEDTAGASEESPEQATATAGASEESPEQAAATATATKEEEEEEEKFEFVEDPIFEIDYKGECAYEVKATIPVANERKLSEDLFEKLRHEAEVPGFRRGRAPRKLIERKFSKAVRNDVEQQLVGAAFEKLIENEDLVPIATPEVEGLEKEKREERKEGEPIGFTMKFEVRPRCELGPYRGLEVERPVFKVEEKDVETAIERMQSRFAVFESLEEGEAADGDQVIIDFKGRVDGEEFAGGSAENYPYVLGTKRFFPEFEEVLTGATPGSTVSCNVVFGEDYSREELRGKTAAFEITVNEIKRRNTPELSDEFAAQAGYDSADDLREKVTSRMRASASGEGNGIAQERLLRAMIEAATFEIPKSMIKRMADSGYEERVEELRRQRTPAAEIQKREGELRAATEAAAIEAIKEWVATQEVAEAEGIEVTDEDFEREAADMAERVGASADAVAEYIGGEDRRSGYEMRFLRGKALECLIGHAEITDRELTPEEFQQELAREDAAPSGEDAGAQEGREDDGGQSDAAE